MKLVVSNMQNITPTDKKSLEDIIDARIKDVLPRYLSSTAFTKSKITDTPTDALEVTNRKYVNLSGTAASRPTSSVATVGQKYFATDTNQQMTFNTTGWYNGVGSIVAQA